MSEEHIMEFLEPKYNLCIAEDAFDKFQAVSMYEEKQYITLPQNVPPDPNGAQSDDNNVASSSVSEVTNPVSSTMVCDDNIIPTSKSQSQSDTSFRDENNVSEDSDMVVSNSENLNNQRNTTVESLTSNILPRKRGRKPKKSLVIPMNDQPADTSQSIQNPDISSTPFSSDSETPAIRNVRKTRGRPKRVITVEKESLTSCTELDPTVGINNPGNQIGHCATKKRRGGRHRQSGGVSIEINAEIKEQALIEQNQLNEDKLVDGLDFEHLKVSNRVLEKSNKLQVLEPSNSEKSETVDIQSCIKSIDGEDPDDVCLSELKKDHDQSNMNNVTSNEKSFEGLYNTSSEIVVDQDQLHKVKKRRGRPKTKQAQPAAISLSQHIEVLDSHSLKTNDTLDDDGDDICLSKLRVLTSDETKLECKDAVNKDNINNIDTINLECKDVTGKDSNDTKTTDKDNVECQQATSMESNVNKHTEDICNQIQISEIEQSNIENKEILSKRSTKMPVMADFEYNIDSVIGTDNAENKSQDNDSITEAEQSLKRPVRRKIKKLQYEEESDEDPFANVELSDDEPMRNRRGNKYYSDDEYLPGKRGKSPIDSTDTEVSESNLETELDNTKKPRKKKFRKKTDSQSPRKRGKKEDNSLPKISDDVSVLEPNCDQNIDIEKSLDSSDTKVADSVTQRFQPSQQWGNTTEFENFIAKKIQGTSLKIKKVGSKTCSESNKIEIPVIDPEAKKTLEMCTQTFSVPTLSTGVQTTSPYHVPLKENVPLTPEQSERACYFLNSIVKTTAEVGTLMIQKSQDFIKKKINTNHVTDTAAMDYCVKKSFLLFKLAKHNLRQMEEDLEKQYDEFLKANDLSKCKEEQKEILPTPKENNSDSDCEIVEVLSVSPKAQSTKKCKPEFNPKTVFLNKELSIKIAKKPNESKKLDIKGRHTVWINDTVMLKKVKPTQSFLAQDSRNKKPPDNYVTEQMVTDFFEQYHHQRVLSICAPFVSTEWLYVNKECICNYFTVKPIKFNDVNHTESNEFAMSISTNNETTLREPSNTISDIISLSKNKKVSCPESLFTLCFHTINSQIQYNLNKFQEVGDNVRSELSNEKKMPATLFRLCLEIINKSITKTVEVYQAIYIPDKKTYHPTAIVSDFLDHADHDHNHMSVPMLKTLCYLKITLIFKYVSSSDDTKPTVLPLKSLCYNSIVHISPLGHELKHLNNTSEMTNSKSQCLSLKSLCYKIIITLLASSSDNNVLAKKDIYSDIRHNPKAANKSCLDKSKKNTMINQCEVDSLLSLCLKYIQMRYMIVENNRNNIFTPKTLQKIAFENVKKMLYISDLVAAHQYEDESVSPGLMINCVNTLSEEAFLNLEHYNADIPDSSDYNDFDNADNFEPDLSGEENVPETSWISKLQMQELRSCINVNNDVDEQQLKITQIKVEPDDITENFLDTIPIKKEPIAGPDEMTIIPDIKSEIDEHISIQRKDSNSYSADEFENFLMSNKLMQPLIDENSDDIYSQRSERIRMQHEPDDGYVNNTDMLNLLVPHTYETMNIQSVKGSLMQSSSDESNKNQNKNITKKAKRTKLKVKKSDQKPKSDVSVSTPVAAKTKEKNITEVAVLTRRMREKIRQEQKQDESTDSENENVGVRLRSRDKKDSSDQFKEKSKATLHNKTTATATKPSKRAIESTSNAMDSSIQPLAPNTPLKEDNNKVTNSKTIIDDSCNKTKNIEIQCNNVDSTEQFEENVANFTGFTPIETNETSTHEKFLKYVYERVIPQTEDEIEHKQKKETNKSDKEPIISPDAPIELLQCEPSMPFFEEIKEHVTTKKKKQLACPASKKNISAPAAQDQVMHPYIERHGWHCYPVHSGDAKLYQNACLYLEKLPESFVQTYFEYQNITRDKNESDKEINRLTNLNSLNRSFTLKERKPTTNSKRQIKDIKTENITEDDLQTESAMDSDHYEELMPSDDENSRVENEVPQLVQKQTENSLAKNLLMHDNDSEDDASSKDLNMADDIKTQDNNDNRKHKKKIVIKSEDSENLMLTADKVMNKELTLLHAPVVLNDKVNDSPTKGPITRQFKKSITKTTPPNNKKKTEEDSSSEEEKQWVSTKEKLLKRLGKKDCASTDDAKRAKLVSEFIERREGNPDGHMRRSGGKRSRRSAKKFLEREKQLRVLERELFGEMSNDPTVSRGSGPAWKGRRNIRKVLDKKSLARSTVVANMEEFERKRRLNARQTELRELLGCEEGVNVLVINDEVCLEYDFKENRPVVTIHPFFTKVMKAHQYEGVKFMWDACFESLADIKARRPGGGCILAHCMGLGKTLQVLALLHTVLTHPRVGMHRVLVCCPLSTVLNWVDEIHKWIGPVTNQIKVFELSKLKKTYERAYQLEDWYNGGGIFIIGYELFRSLSTLDPLLDDVRPTIINKIRTALLDPGPDIVVCDEGHLLKNDCSVLAVAMSRVVTKRRIVLTGTPMQNNLREYYCMVNFVKPNLLGTYSEYSNRFENPIMNGQHRDSSEADIKLMKARTHILHKVLEGCLQRQEASVLYPYLPKKYEYTVFINLTQCQWDLYKHYLNHYSRHLKHNSILKDFHILQKIWSHPQVLHNFQTNAQEHRNKIKLEKLEDDLATEDLKEDMKDGVATELWWLQYLDGGNMLETLESSNKFVVVFRILEECVALGDKVLIFSTSLICLNSLEYFLKKIKNWSLGQEYYRLDGSVPAEVRQKWCREFNAENNVHTKLFLVSTRAGCLGLNMTAANRVIIMDTSWNPAHDIQSIFRVYRFGQKKDCFIYRLVAMGTMEQKIYERAVTKQAVACRVVDEQQIDRHYNMAELTELYRYDEAGSSVASGVAVGVRDVALLRVARDTSLHAVHEHDSLLRSSEQGLPEHERAAAWMQFQQEQTDKQMQNTEKAKIPKISLKRVHGQNYTKSVSIKHENTDSNNDDFVPPTETRPRRGRKPKVARLIPGPTQTEHFPEQITPDINTDSNNDDFVPATETRLRRGRKAKVAHLTPGPSQMEHCSEQITADIPGPSQAIDLCGEESMVEKISEILLRHNFQNRKSNTDVAQLLANVKKIVKQGYMYPTDSSDDVTASIAQVLLTQRQASHALNDNTPEPTFNSILSESTVPQPDLSVIIPDPVDMSSQTSQAENEVIVPGKTRRRKPAILRSRYSATQRQATHALNDNTPEPTFNSVLSESTEPQPDLSVIIPDPVDIPSQTSQAENEVIVPDKTRRRKPAILRSRYSATPASSSLEPESILGFSHNNEEVLHNNEEVLPDSRKKRRAAIAAEKQFDLLSNAVIINLDDEHDTTDGDFVPNIVKKTEKSSKIKRRNNFNETTQEENKNAKESTLSSKITFIESDTEISEEAVAKSMSKSNYKPGPKRYKEKVSKENRKEPVQVEDQPTLIESNDLCSTSGVRDLTASPTASATVQSISTADDDEENIPLPLSLLTNKNFINIVAHTYLNGNPMLDADAATLAAKYSTLKALKEAEQTGKDIVSGAIYDIAVKVIGKHLFKRMANIQVDNNKSGSSILVEEEDFTIQLKDNLEVEQPDVTIKLKDKKQIKTESKENSRLRTRASKEKKSSVSNIVDSKTNEKNITNIADNFSSHVVPVGMIQSAGSLPSGEFASNESILPHDDEEDMLFISSDIPPSREETNSTVMTPTQPVQSSITTNTENSNTLNLMQESPVCLNDGAPASLSTTPTPGANVITIARGKIMLHTSVVSGASKNTKQLPTQSLPSETICLDSDDEDSVTPVTTSASLSVSTQQTSNDEPEVLSTPTDQSIAESIQGVPQNSLLIRQISVGNIPKFVLVPTNTFSKYLSKDLQRETTTTQSPVTVTTASVATSSKSYPPATTKHSSATTTKQILIAETSQDSATTTKHRSAITSPQILTTKNTPILTTTTPSAACLSKLKQAQCKPGDIIKISDKGEIEVLQVKKEAGAKSSAKSSVSVSEVMKSIPNKSANKKSHESKKISLINDTTKQATNMSDAEKAIVADKILSQPSSSIQRKSDMVTLKARTLSVSSSSSSSRPTTPIDNNPLSILKDVVHIQAAEDKTEKKPSSRSQKSNVPNVYVAHRSGSKQSAKLLDKNSKDSIIRQKLQIKRIVPGKDNKMLKDLLNKKSAKPIAKIANAVKDGLKSIVIDGAITPKKLSTPIDLVGFGTVKAGSGASMLRTKIEIKKRSSTSESSPLKKTKTEQMTLKDFNIEDIDDLDDIIELE